MYENCKSERSGFRGGLILDPDDYGDKINHVVFPKKVVTEGPNL